MSNWVEKKRLIKALNLEVSSWKPVSDFDLAQALAAQFYKTQPWASKKEFFNSLKPQKEKLIKEIKGYDTELDALWNNACILFKKDNLEKNYIKSSPRNENDEFFPLRKVFKRWVSFSENLFKWSLAQKNWSERSDFLNEVMPFLMFTLEGKKRLGKDFISLLSLCENPIEAKHLCENMDMTEENWALGLQELKDTPNSILPEVVEVFWDHFGKPNKTWNSYNSEAAFALAQTPELLEKWRTLNRFPLCDILALWSKTLSSKSSLEIQAMLQKGTELGLSSSKVGQSPSRIEAALSTLPSALISQKNAHAFIHKSLADVDVFRDTQAIKDWKSITHQNFKTKWDQEHQFWKTVVKWIPDINIQDEDGWSALHYAAFRGHCMSMEMMLEVGANPTLKTIEGLNPLTLYKTSLKIHSVLGMEKDNIEEKDKIILLLEHSTLGFELPKAEKKVSHHRI